MINRRTHYTYDENKVKIVRQKRKIHRCKEHISFLSKCISHELCPAFTRFSPEQLSLVNWSPRTLKMKRIERAKLALAVQEQNFNTLSLTLSKLISKLIQSFPNINLSSFLSTCDREVRINQRADDIKRREKFSKLKKSKNTNFTKVNVIVVALRLCELILISNRYFARALRSTGTSADSNFDLNTSNTSINKYSLFQLSRCASFSR
jgi:hypothetical protein